MKTFLETTLETLSFNPDKRSMIFEEEQIEHMTDEEVKAQELMYNNFCKYLEENSEIDLNNLDEGLFGGLVGLAAGPALGKIICKILSIEKGILYDLFTSRLFGAAAGSAIGNKFS